MLTMGQFRKVPHRRADILARAQRLQQVFSVPAGTVGMGELLKDCRAPPMCAFPTPKWPHTLFSFSYPTKGFGFLEVGCRGLSPADTQNREKRTEN